MFDLVASIANTYFAGVLTYVTYYIDRELFIGSSYLLGVALRFRSRTPELARFSSAKLTRIGLLCAAFASCRKSKPKG